MNPQRAVGIELDGSDLSVHELDGNACPSRLRGRLQHAEAPDPQYTHGPPLVASESDAGAGSPPRFLRTPDRATAYHPEVDPGRAPLVVMLYAATARVV